MSLPDSQPETPAASDIPADSVDAEATEPIPAPRKSRGLVTALVATSIVVVLAIGVGAFAAYRMAFTSDAHPEKSIPASALAYAALDLDPGLGQQARLVALAKKFPKIKDVGNPRKWVENVFDAAGLKDIDAKNTIEPWLGLRAGVALWLHDKAPYAVVAVESRDDDAAGTGLAKVASVSKHGTVGFHVSDGIALIAVGEKDAQAAADAAAAEAAKGALDTNSKYASARAWLPGDEVLTVWADLDGLADAIDDLAPDELTGLMGGELTQFKGTAVLGARADDNGLEIRSRSFSGAQGTPAAKDPLNTIGTLPANTTIGIAAGVPDLAEGGGAGSLGLLGLAGFTGTELNPAMLDPTVTDPGSDEPTTESDDFMKIQEAVVNGLSNAFVTVAVNDVDRSSPSIFAQITAENSENADALMNVAGIVEKLGHVKVARDGTTVTVTSSTYQSQSGTLSGSDLFTAATAGAPDGRTAAAFIDLSRTRLPAEVSAAKAVGIVAGLEQGDTVTLIRVVIR